MYATDLFNLMVLSQQGVRTVGYTHGKDSHCAYHHHGNIDIWKNSHDRGSYSKAEGAQHVDDLDAEVVVVQVFLENSWKAKANIGMAIQQDTSRIASKGIAVWAGI